MKMKILIACEESQAVTKEFRKRGHEAYSCDIEPCSGGHPEWHIKQDIMSVIDCDCPFQTGDMEIHNSTHWDMLIAHPDCTRLTNAGVRWLHEPPKGKTFDDMWHDLYKAVEFYIKLKDSDIYKKAIENPIFHKYARAMIQSRERQIVQPWWFGDKAFKATGFELYNLPPLIPTNKLNTPQKGTEEHKKWSFIHRMAPSKDRKKLRSKTFHGIAKAMAEQWGNL